MKKQKKVSDDTKEKGISQAHDQFFRTVMQDKRVASAEAPVYSNGLIKRLTYFTNKIVALIVGHLEANLVIGCESM